MGNETRLARLEKSVEPGEKTFLCVYWQEGKGYWLAGEHRKAVGLLEMPKVDYKGYTGGEGAIFISEERFHQLELEYDIVFLCKRGEGGTGERETA